MTDGMYSIHTSLIHAHNSNIFSSGNVYNDGYRRNNTEGDRQSFRNRNEYVRQDNRNDYFRQDNRNDYSRQDNRNDYSRQDGRNQSFSRFNRNDNPRRTPEQNTNENQNQWERSNRQ